MKLNHIYKSIACGVLLAMTATSCDLDYNPVDTYSDVTEGVNKTDEKPIFNSVQDVETSMVTLHKNFVTSRSTGMSTNCLSVTLIPIMPTPEQRGPKWCLTKPTPLKALILY